MGPKKYKDGAVILEASSTTESIVNDMFGKERVDFQNIPIPSTQREMTGDTTDDIISEILKQLDFGLQLSVKNVEELNAVLEQKLQPKMRAKIEYLFEYWELLLKNFTFDDFNLESYEKLYSFAFHNKNNPRIDEDDGLGSLDSALLDIARVECFIFGRPGSSISSHSAWRNMYHQLLDGCVRSVRKSRSLNQPSSEDVSESAPFVCYNGECKFEVKVIIEDDAKPSPEIEMPPPCSSGTSELSTGIEKERSITVRAVPDLTIYSMCQFKKSNVTIPIIVFEIKTSKKGQLNQAEYIDKKSDGSSKEKMTDGGDSNASLEFGAGDAGQVNLSRKRSNRTVSDDICHESIKKRKIGRSSSSSLSKKDNAKSKRLECVKTQHFF